MKSQTITAIAVAALVAGLLFGQTSTQPASSGEFEWEMFGSHVAVSDDDYDYDDDDRRIGIGSDNFEAVQGFTFIYNKRTGKVYRFFDDCGADGQHGCFDDMPVLEGTTRTRLPTPQSVTGTQVRR